jgi:oligoendopeptidase F
MENTLNQNPNKKPAPSGNKHEGNKQPPHPPHRTQVSKFWQKMIDEHQAKLAKYELEILRPSQDQVQHEVKTKDTHKHYNDLYDAVYGPKTKQTETNTSDQVWLSSSASNSAWMAASKPSQ